MDLLQWKNVLGDKLNALCSEICVNDAAIDWVDIVFEHVGNASKCPPHSHTWFEFNYVLAGHLITRFGKQPATIRAGEFFLIPPGLVHSHTYTKGNPHEGICFRWRIRRLEQPGLPASQQSRLPAAHGSQGADGLPGQGSLLSAQSAEAPIISQPARNARDIAAQPANTSDSFYERLDRLRHWQPGSCPDQHGIRGLLSSLLAETAAGTASRLSLQLRLVQLLEALAGIQESAPPSPHEGSSSDALIRKVEVYLEDFMGEQLNVADLASSLHMSYGHLSRLYKSRTGITLIERMNQLRLAKAHRLLQEQSLLIKEVAEQAGFRDIYYFSKAFKRKYGISPQAYRKSQNL